MSFLSPFLLWLLPLTFLPLIIHLINQRNITTINFSTIKFLKIIEDDSIRKLQFIQILLLILRTLIILFIILMISRPTIKDTNSNYFNDISTAHAILLDDSYSMLGNNEHISNAINTILNQIPNKSQLLWVNKNNGLQYNGLKEDITNINSYINSTYLQGSLYESLNILKNNLNEKNSKTILYIITDDQDQDLKEINTFFDELKSFYTFFIISPPINDNLSIYNAKIINEILIPNNPITIDVEIQNNGLIDKSDILLQLLIDEVIVAQQLISLKALTNETFTFKTSVPNNGIYNAKIELEHDNKLDDNNFYFNLIIPDNINIAILASYEEDLYYFKESINTLNNFGENITITKFNFLKDLMIKLNEFDNIYIFDPNALTLINDSRIEEYIYSGGYISIFPSIYSSGTEYKNINLLSSEITDNYQSANKISIENTSFQQIDLNFINKDKINNIFLKNKNEQTIKFFEYINLPVTDNSILKLENQASIWNRYKLQSGIIDIFGFSMNLNSTNLPIKGSFLPFIHHLIHSNNQNMHRPFLRTGTDWTFRTKKNYLNTIYYFLPNDIKNIILQDQNNEINIKSLSIPGFHYIESDKVKIKNTSVNIIENELYANRLNLNNLKKNLPTYINVISMDKFMLENIKEVSVGQELWRIILILILVLLLIEMYISNSYANSKN